MIDVTRHALIRMRERIRSGTDKDLIRLLERAVEEGTPFGESYILGQRFVLYHNFVVHVTRDGEMDVVRTVLTPEEARQAGGFRPCT